ncbi:hypothetical protein [Bacillus sp. SM2101]|uniref:hypothetical protein n=1 Tax=Bacillus sp. SM2101 TaxID=2805366 RepID=UPI001BDE8767|nr:hypothetical protein [Bacillus sp. SM2101]
MQNTKKFIAAASLSALLIGGGYTAFNAEGVPQASASVKANETFTVPLEVIKQEALYYDPESKVLFNIVGDVLVQFEDGKMYNGDGGELSQSQYEEILKDYQGIAGVGLPLTQIDDAYLAGINPIGKTYDEIAEELQEVYERKSLKLEATKIGIDVKNLTEDELKAEVDNKRLDYIEKHFLDAIKKLKKAYQLDPEAYQNAGIDLTDKTDEEISELISSILKNSYEEIPIEEGENFLLPNTSYGIVQQFIDWEVNRWSGILSEAAELGVDTTGLSTNSIISLNYSMKKAIERDMDIEGKTSQEIHEIVQDVLQKEYMEETGKTKEELIEERP